jgi:hypothetical protein
MKTITRVLIALALFLPGAAFAQTGQAWRQLPGTAKDIGIEADGSVWIIGTNPSGTKDNFGVHRWTGKDWFGLEGGGVQISVDKSGLPWVVNALGDIFHRQ